MENIKFGLELLYINIFTATMNLYEQTNNNY